MLFPVICLVTISITFMPLVCITVRFCMWGFPFIYATCISISIALDWFIFLDHFSLFNLCPAMLKQCSTCLHVPRTNVHTHTHITRMLEITSNQERNWKYSFFLYEEINHGYMTIYSDFYSVFSYCFMLCVYLSCFSHLFQIVETLKLVKRELTVEYTRPVWFCVPNR